MGFDPGVFGRFDLAALVQPHLKFLFVCLLYSGMATAPCHIRRIQLPHLVCLFPFMHVSNVGAFVN